MTETLTDCASCGSVARCTDLAVGEPQCVACVAGSGHDHEDTELGACELCVFVGADQTSAEHVAGWLCDHGYDAVVGGLAGGQLRVLFDYGWAELYVYRTSQVMVATFADDRPGRPVAQSIVTDGAGLLAALESHAMLCEPMEVVR
jgi:hypothetical protein